MKENGRKKNTILNSISGVSFQIVSMFLSFASRSIFLSILNAEYLGVSSLFSSILTMLSFAELGFGSAFAFSLYAPLAEKNNEKIKSIMFLFKKVYIAIGLFILCGGLLCVPFLDIIIDKSVDVEHLTVIYILYVINSASSYFFSYNQTLLNADQKNYLIIKYDIGFRIISVIAINIGLIITKQFIVYLTIQVLISVIENFVKFKKVQTRYPVLKEKKVKPLDKVTKKEIKKNTLALAMYKLSTVISDSMDSLIIAKFIDVITLGYCTNYSTVISALNGFLVKIESSVIVSVGNYNAIESEDDQESMLKRIQFFNSYLYGLCASCLLVLLNPFIELWLGIEYVLPISIVIPLVLYFYLVGVQNTAGMFRNTKGLFWYGKTIMIIRALLNLIVSVILVKITKQTSSTYWGSVISYILTVVWYDPYIVYKHGLHRKGWLFAGKYIYYLLVSIIATVIQFNLSKFFAATIIGFVLNGFMCVTIFTLIFILSSSCSLEFKYFSSVIKEYTKVIIKSGGKKK